MIGTLPTWRWAASDEAAPLLDELAGGVSLNALARLRERWSAEAVAVASELVEARARAGVKFPGCARTLIADCEGLEMASSARAAAHKAARFRGFVEPGSAVLDACCGIGGDAMGLAAAGFAVTALDLDERRAWMAGSNAGCAHEVGDVVGRPVDGALHIDPARRSDGNRTHELEGFEPAFDAVEGLARRATVAAVKLNPGVRADLLPEGEVEIVSERGKLTQAVLWMGESVPHQRRATLLAGDGETCSLSGQADRPDDVNEIGAWIHTMDPSVERADLVGVLLEQTGLGLVHPGTGLLTGGSANASPWVTAFRVVESCVWNLKAVKRVLRGMDAGVVAVKTRAGVVDADRLSRQLRGKGEREAVVFVLPIGDRVRAIVAEWCGHKRTPPGAVEAPGGVWMAGS